MYLPAPRLEDFVDTHHSTTPLPFLRFHIFFYSFNYFFVFITFFFLLAHALWAWFSVGLICCSDWILEMDWFGCWNVGRLDGWTVGQSALCFLFFFGFLPDSGTKYYMLRDSPVLFFLVLGVRSRREIESGSYKYP